MSIVPNFTRFTSISGMNTSLDKKIDLTEKGAVNGVCPLDANGLINPSYYDPNVMQFLGTWDAFINSPVLADGTGDVGDMYIISVGGDQFTPTITFTEGDFVIYDGTKWKRVPTNLNTKLSSISNTDGNLTIDNTDPINPIINTNLTASNVIADDSTHTYIYGVNVQTQLNNIDVTVKALDDALSPLPQRSGAYLPLIYTYKSSPITTGAQLSGNGATVAGTNSIHIGYQPVNRGIIGYEYIEQLLIKMRAQTNWRLRMIDTTNNLRATFSLTYTGAGVGDTYLSVVIPSETNMVNMPTDGTGIICYFDYFIPREANEITTNTTGNYTTISNVQSNINQLDTQVFTNATNIANNKVRATLQESNLVSYRFTGNDYSDITTTFNAFGSMQIHLNVPFANSWRNTYAIFPNIPKSPFHFGLNGGKSFFYAIQLMGNGYEGATNLSLLVVGISSEMSLSRSQTFMTSDLNTFYHAQWLTSATSQDKTFTMRLRTSLLTDQPQAIYNSAGYSVTSYTGTPPVNANQGQVLVFYYNQSNSSFVLELRNDSVTPGQYNVIQVSCVFTSLDAGSTVSNWFSHKIVPFFAVGAQNTTDAYDIRVLSERECINLDVSVPNSENIFY
jgi:hypothetical protein